jgi:hypothetical protein
MPRGRRFRHWSDVVGWTDRQAASAVAFPVGESRRTAFDELAAELFAAGWEARGRDVSERLATAVGASQHNSVDPRDPSIWAP